MYDTSRAIIATLAYFDVFNHPLTSEELYNFLWNDGQTENKPSYANFLNELEQSKLQKTINQKDGFYFLHGREEIVATQQRAVRHVAKKLDRAKRAGKLIRFVPFVEAMFVCNTVSAGSADANSDIDVLIIIKHGRIWLTRLLVTGLLGLFRIRRTKTRIANQICLSFYLTDKDLNLKSIALPDQDIYLCYWIRQLLPIYDPTNIFEKIQSANRWIDQFVRPVTMSYNLIERYHTIDSKFSRIIKTMFEKFWTGGYGDLIESQAKGFQQAHMKMHAAKNTPANRNVIVNDAMMKFHENDRREYFREKWIEKFQETNSKIQTNSKIKI